MAAYRLPLALTALVAVAALAPLASLRKTSPSPPSHEAVLVPGKVSAAFVGRSTATSFWRFRASLEGDDAFIHYSPDRKLALRVDPKTMTVALKRGWRRLWEIPWPQDAPPQQALIRDDGSRVLLIGSFRTGWHGDLGGNGLEVVLLDERGKVIAALRPADIDMGQDTAASDPEIVSIGFRNDELCQERSSVTLSPSQECGWFAVVGSDRDDNARYACVSIRLSDGAQLALDGRGKDRILEPVRQAMRSNLRSTDTVKIWEGLQQAGRLADRDVLAEIFRIIRQEQLGALDGDLESTATSTLLEIPGGEGRDYVLDRVKRDKDFDKWWPYLEKAKALPDEATLARMAANKDPEKRSDYLFRLESLDPARARLQALASLKDSNSEVRSSAACVLARVGMPGDSESVRPLLKDRGTQFGAVLALIRFKPADLSQILLEHANDPKSPARWTAIAELAKSGNQKAVAALIKAASDYCTTDEAGPFYMGYEDACLILALYRAPDAEAILTKLAETKSSPSEQYLEQDVHARGALALMGHRQHLPFLRMVAAGTDPPDKDAIEDPIYDKYRRASAIGWLGALNDRESIPLLRSLERDYYWEVRNAAARALGQISAASDVPTWPISRPD